MRKGFFCKTYRLPCFNGSKAEKASTGTCIFLKSFASLSDGNESGGKAKNMCFH